MLLLEENQQVKVRVLGFEGTKQCVLIGPLTLGKSNGDESEDGKWRYDIESDEDEQQDGVESDGDEQQEGVESDEDESFIYERYYVLPYFDVHPR